jgi:hypothetical protein
MNVVSDPDSDWIYEPSTGRMFKEYKTYSETRRDDRVTSNRFRYPHCGQKSTTHIIWKIMTGNWPTTNLIDHKDGNGYNTKWSNLREATYSQNARNRDSPGRWKDNDLDLEMGVTRSSENSFRVVINRIVIGSYSTSKQANAIAKAWREQINGEFSHANREPSSYPRITRRF